ncbi:MAG: hypothetical protein WKF75_19970 [Singulisphaera sp.]
MRQNVPTKTRRPLSTFGRRSPVQAQVWTWPTVLVVLILLTSLAVASVSAWLVLPYLILMSLILLPTALRRDAAAADLGSGSGAGVTVAGLDEAGSLVASPPSADPAPSATTAAGSGDDRSSAHLPGAVKARRGKARGRDRTRSMSELPDVAWVRVGPGKFVRVDPASRAIDGATLAPESEPSPPVATSDEAGEVEERQDPPPSSLEAEVAPAPVDSLATVGEVAPPIGHEGPEEWQRGEEDGPGIPAVAGPPPARDEASPPDVPEAAWSAEAADDVASAFLLDEHHVAVYREEVGPASIDHDEGPDDEEVAERIFCAPQGREGTGSEIEPGDAPRDNGIAPDAFDEVADRVSLVNERRGDLGSEIEPGDAPRDNGIAPEAFGPAWPAQTERSRPEEVAEDRPMPVTPSPRAFPTEPAARCHSLGPRRTRARGGHSSRRGTGAPGPRRVPRPGRSLGAPPGPRRGARRDVRRFRQICRTFPPRSPPLLV